MRNVVDTGRLRAGMCSVVLAATCASCNDGVVAPLALIAAETTGDGGTSDDAGQPTSASSGRGGRGGYGGYGGLSGRGARGGADSARAEAGAAGSESGLAEGCFPTAESEKSEMQLLEALNQAIEGGYFCPNLRKPLDYSRELASSARAILCFSSSPAMPTHGWRPLPWRTWNWIAVTSTLEEAKITLVDDDPRRELCEAASRIELVGIAHVGDYWSVLISDDPSSDMQKQ